MEKKINIAELLRDCPKGMELYSTIYGTVYFERVKDTGNAVLIEVKTSCNSDVQFYPDGKFNTYYSDSEITLFPSKDVRTWEGFHRPFKDGEIVACDSGDNVQVFIFKNKKENNTTSCCYLMLDDDELDLEEGMYYITRLATEEEKQKLFQAIKDNGYKWNPETKSLEKLLSFKVGDRIKEKGDYISGIITQIDIDNFYKVEYCGGSVSYINSKYQDNYELVPNKFDITKLKTFDKVLVRNTNKDS